jgi:hypothetical protein
LEPETVAIADFAESAAAPALEIAAGCLGGDVHFITLRLFLLWWE